MWKIKKRNKYGTLWEGQKGRFVDVRKMFTHGGYNPKSMWYVFLAENKSDLIADYVFASRLQAEKKARTYMKSNPNG